MFVTIKACRDIIKKGNRCALAQSLKKLGFMSFSYSPVVISTLHPFFGFPLDPSREPVKVTLIC